MQVLNDREHENSRLQQAITDLRDAAIKRDLVGLRCIRPLHVWLHPGNVHYHYQRTPAPNVHRT